MRTMAAFGVLVVGVLPAVAQEAQGVYVGTGANQLTATVFATEGDAPFAGRFTTGTPGTSTDQGKCSGDFAATGTKTESNKLEFKGSPEAGKACTITMTFAKDFSAAIIDEDGCGNYHGPSCNFTGAVQRQSR